MVAFGNAILSARRQGWEAAYVDYEGLKELILQSQAEEDNKDDDKDDNDDNLPPLPPQHAFLDKLQQEIEKVSLFALYRQGEIAKALGALRQPQTLRPLFVPKTLTLSSLSTTTTTGTATATTTKGADAQVQQQPQLQLQPNTMEPPRRPPPAQAFTQCAVELLHWQRFVCINAVGIRKIIKKFQKHHVNWRHYHAQRHTKNDKHNSLWVEQDGLPWQRHGGGSSITADDPHLQQLANSAAVAAMTASLWQACRELQPPPPPQQRQQQLRSSSYQRGNEYNQDDQDDHDDDDKDENDLTTMRGKRQEWIRLHCTVSMIQAMRNYAKSMNESFLAFLSNKSMIYGGQPLLSNPDESDVQALNVFLHFEPDTLLTMDAKRLQNVWEDDNTFLDSSFRVTNKADKDWGGVDSKSLCLNLLSTLLYTINYYIVAPTANHYAIKLGVDGAYGASLVGASSLMAIFAAFLYSWWYTRYSFQSALLFSAICPCVGNMLYSLAISYRSMPMAMFGRLMVGLGSAEVVNRQLISTCVSFDSITSASAYFVAAGASGMSIGPLMAAVLDMSTGYDVNVDLPLPFTPARGIIFNHVTSPGFVMAILWSIQACALIAFFREPTRIHSGLDTDEDARWGSDTSLDVRVKATLESVGVTLDEEETLPLMATTNADERKGNALPWNPLTEIKKTGKIIFGNMALPVTLYLFGLIELVDEILISSCSMVSRRYFGWPGSTAGFIVASLGALVLPAHFVVEKAAHHFDERFILKYSLIFLVLCLFGILNYEGLIFDFIGTAIEVITPSEGVLPLLNSTDHKRNTTDIKVSGLDLIEVLNEEDEVPYDWGAGRPVYLIFLSAIFLGTIVLEGVDTSLMAKVTPPALNASFVNCGLLATLIGTLGRVVGDSLITLSAFVDKDIFADFVNATFFPMILLVAFGLFLATRFYHLLV